MFCTPMQNPYFNVLMNVLNYPTLIHLMQEEELYIYGIHPVTEALQQEQTKVDRVFIKDGIRSKHISTLQETASSRRVPVVFCQGRKLADMVGRVNDQGVVARISPVSYTELEDWLDSIDIKKNPFVLVLDEIEDVHNFGAILRTSAAAGADAVIIPKHRQAPVNATVYKTSAGTAGKIPIIRVTNINQTISTLKDAGFWVAALDNSGKQTIWDADFNSPMVLLIGSEGSGIRKKTMEASDFILRIPMSNNVESLNASVSASVLMYEIIRRRSKK